MNHQQELTSLVKELVEANQALARSLEHIVTSIEQISGHVPEGRDLSSVASQLAGLHIRLADLLDQQTRRDEGSTTPAPPPPS
jgi:methyl-accepting chemotaxis protein